MDSGKAAARRTARWLGGGVALMVGGTVAAFVLARSWTPEPPPKLLFSKETTYLTGPLQANGGIDWVAALLAEAKAAGFREEENGAPLMKEAVRGFVDAWKYVEALSPTDEWKERLATDDAVDRGLEALAKGELDAPHVDLLLRWLEACEPSFEKARQAAERSDWFLIGDGNILSPYVTLVEIEGIFELTSALGLSVTARTARADVEGALADAAAACVAARAIGTPGTLIERDMALEREVALLRQLLRSVRATPPLPADRVWTIVSQRPTRLRGDAALREGLRADRIVMTSELAAGRLFESDWPGREGRLKRRVVHALQLADRNPLLRRLQQTFDRLESLLLDSGQPAADRFTAFHAEVDRLSRECPPISVVERRQNALTSMFLSDQELANLAVDDHLFYGCNAWSDSDWLSLTAKRDALLAKLAFLAGAPALRDSWLGEPLVVTREEDDDSITVGGALLELARARDPEFDEEE